MAMRNTEANIETIEKNSTLSQRRVKERVKVKVSLTAQSLCQ